VAPPTSQIRLAEQYRKQESSAWMAPMPCSLARKTILRHTSLAKRVDIRKGHIGREENPLGSESFAWRRTVDDCRERNSPPGNAARRPEVAHAWFQLWANLPSSPNMTAPRYQDTKAAEIPEIVDDDGTSIRVICGTFWGRRGPVEGVAAEPRYLDVFVPPGRRKSLPVETERHAFAYVFEGSGTFGSASQPFGVLTEKVGDRGGTTIRERAGNRSLVLFDSGDEVTVQAGEEGMRFLLVSGKPIEEPVAWHGPIVMNTEAELEQAYAELRNGTFIKKREQR
jgi:quercetin 2,3-dioxygenase